MRLRFVFAAAAMGFVLVQPSAGGADSDATPPLAQLKTSNVVLSACNALAYGYEVDGQLIQLGAKEDYCGDVELPDATFSVPTDKTPRMYLADLPCGAVFFSDGNHARVVGSNPWEIDIMDAGGLCEFSDDPREPGPDTEIGNLSLTLTQVDPTALAANPVIARVEPREVFVDLSARLTYGPGLPAAGQEITFLLSDDTHGCTATTDALGFAACSAPMTTVFAIPQQGYQAVFNGSEILTPSSDEASLIEV